MTVLEEIPVTLVQAFHAEADLPLLHIAQTPVILEVDDPSIRPHLQHRAGSLPNMTGFSSNLALSIQSHPSNTSSLSSSLHPADTFEQVEQDVTVRQPLPEKGLLVEHISPERIPGADSARNAGVLRSSHSNYPDCFDGR